MSKKRTLFVCSSCGAQSLQWKGQCTACHEWNTLKEFSFSTSKNSIGKNLTGGRGLKSERQSPIILSQVSNQDFRPFPIGIPAFDRVLGMGLVPGSAILVGGEPGIGKSTLLLQIAGLVARGGRTVLYASGEESLLQLKHRAERLQVFHDNLTAMATSSVEDVIEAISNSPPALLILDSVQTMTSLEAEGLPGNVSQVKAVSTVIQQTCRECGTIVIFVGHVTKDGVLAGPKLLEHMVDTVISLEGDRSQMFRLLRVFKNRFGPNEELLVFKMTRDGLQLVEDPSTFFLGDRDASLSGAAVVMGIDGHRPLAVEIQALVTRSYLSIPRRTALGFDVNRLNLLLAVLEKRLKLNFTQVDIYAKIGSGIRIQEPALDLAIVAAVLSSFYDIPLPEKCVFWGEVDLNGQIRPVSGQELRLSQAKRLGYGPIYHPDSNNSGISAISAMQRLLFHRS